MSKNDVRVEIIFRHCEPKSIFLCYTRKVANIILFVFQNDIQNYEFGVFSKHCPENMLKIVFRLYNNIKCFKKVKNCSKYPVK